MQVRSLTLALTLALVATTTRPHILWLDNNAIEYGAAVAIIFSIVWRVGLTR